MATDMDVTERAPTGGIATRLLALATLASVIAGVAYVGREGYRALTDSFVAPIILSPDNDLVIQNKVKLSELEVERTKSESELEAIEGDLAAYAKALVQLKELEGTTQRAIAWTSSVTNGQASAGASDLRTLGRQRAVLGDMLDKQQRFAAQTQANMTAGLTSRTEYTKELQALNQIQLAVLENDRTRMQVGLQVSHIALARKSLAAGGGSIPMPELVARQEQLVRIDLEMLKLEAEQRTKTAQKRLITEKLGKIIEVEAQLKARPIFRAVDRSIDVAFVPYSQIDGMREGGRVLDCVWGLFACKTVGTVTEIVPGEVILPDPWGTQARGQIVVLELGERESAKSRTLRVRQGTTAAPRLAVK
jgi:hypothetical protein